MEMLCYLTPPKKLPWKSLSFSWCGAGGCGDDIPAGSTGAAQRIAGVGERGFFLLLA
jgi:hypothetical protein